LKTEKLEILKAKIAIINKIPYNLNFTSNSHNHFLETVVATNKRAITSLG